MARILVAANSSWNLRNFRAGLIRSLVEAGHEIITVSPDEEGLSIGGRSIAHRQWAMDRSSTRPFNNMKSLAAMLLLIRREHPDVFLGFTIKPNIYGCIACRMLKVRAIPNVSGLGTAFLGKSAFRRAVLQLYRFAFSGAQTTFFQNADDERLFLEEGVVRPAQSKVLPGSGVNLRDFEPSALPGSPRFLMVARLLRDKGVREYVEAARQVKGRVPDATFSLLGELDHENRSSISSGELEAWTSEGVIEYLGSSSDVRPFIRNSAAVVLPSYREGLPRTLLEGAAMGRPLIGTDVPGCRQVVREGVTGFLCQPRSAQSLAAAMERLATSSYAARMRMGAEARAMVEREFDEKLVIRAYFHALFEVSSLCSS